MSCFEFVKILLSQYSPPGICSFAQRKKKATAPYMIRILARYNRRVFSNELCKINGLLIIFLTTSTMYVLSQSTQTHFPDSARSTDRPDWGLPSAKFSYSIPGKWVWADLRQIRTYYFSDSNSTYLSIRFLIPTYLGIYSKLYPKENWLLFGYFGFRFIATVESWVIT